MVYHKRPCDPTARAPLPGDLRHHVLDRRLPRDPARARTRRRARGLAGRARRRRLRIRAHGCRHSDRSLPHAPPEARGRGRPVRARRGRPRSHGGRDVPRPRAGSAPDGRGPRARDGGRAHGDPPLPHRLEPRLGAQRVRVLGDDRHPLRHGAGRGAAIEPQLEPGAAGHVRPAAPRHPDAPGAPITPALVLAFVAGGAIAVAYSTVEQFSIPLRGSRELGLERAGVALLLVVMQVFDIAALLPLGVLADRRGTVPVLVAVLLVMAAASALVGFGTLPVVAAGCALYGLGMAGWMLPLGVLRRETPQEHVAWRTGLYRVCENGRA